MLLIALGLLCTAWAVGVLVVVGMCRGAARADADANLSLSANGDQTLRPHLRLIA